MKKILKFLLRFSLVIVILLVGGIYYFFKTNDAPILKGEVDFCIEFKQGLLVDIYLPTKKIYEKTPVVVYYHGGAWVIGRKETVNNARFNRAFNSLRDDGYAIISPEYTLGEYGKSPFPNNISDAFDVMIWIEENAEKYNFDLQNIGVMGESAGGHLALMTAFAEAEQFNSRTKNSLQYVVAVYPPTDLHYLYHDQQFILDSINLMTIGLPESIQKRLDLNQYLFGFDPELDSLKAHFFTENYSPINYISKKKIPTLIIHGDKDQLVPISQSKFLIEKLNQAAIPNEYHFLEGVDHALRGATNPQKEQVQNWIANFVNKNYVVSKD